MSSLILLNGGVGRRVTPDKPKQFLKINGIPILVFSLVAADDAKSVHEIILNYPEGWLDETKQVVEKYGIQTPVRYVEAGATRHESVARMISACQYDQVIIHESARPLISGKEIEFLIEQPHANVSYMLEIPFTVAPVDPDTRKVTGSLERNKLRNVQLPQKFSKAELTAAHRAAQEKQVVFTEDATLLAVEGYDVRFIPGTDRNFKVTTPLDVKLAGFLLGPKRDESND